MQLSLSPEESAFREEVRDFLRRELSDGFVKKQKKVAGFFIDPSAAREWQGVLHRSGWGAPAWPVEFGGTGWTAVQRYIFEDECAKAGAPYLQNAGIRMAGPVIMRFGSDSQKAEYLPRMLSGRDYWCQGYSEPGAGSDLASLKTSAVREGDHYRVNGSKIWTTYAHCANRMFALVRTGTGPKPQDGISFLLLDMAAPGITVRPILSLGGDHEVNQVFFDDVRVPVTGLVGEEGKGWTCAKYLLEFERGGNVNGPRIRASLERVLALATRLRGPMNSWSALMAARVAEVQIEVETFEFTELRMLSALKVGSSPGAISSMIRLRGSQIRQLGQRLAVDLLSESAFRGESDSEAAAGVAEHGTGLDEAPLSEEIEVMLAQHFNGRAYTVVGGASDIQRDIMAKSWLKL